VLQREQLSAATSCSGIAVSCCSSKYWIEQGSGKSSFKDHSSSLSSRRIVTAGTHPWGHLFNIMTSGVINKIVLLVDKHSEIRRSSRSGCETLT